MMVEIPPNHGIILIHRIISCLTRCTLQDTISNRWNSLETPRLPQRSTSGNDIFLNKNNSILLQTREWIHFINCGCL